MNTLYIDKKETLERFVASVPEHGWIAIDTEFMREKNYFSQLCLVQIATADTLACIDPLKIDDLAALGRLLLNPAIIKVLHAAHQDLEIFYFLFGKVPAPVFDTQAAAAVLGTGDQISYARLVQEFLDVTLEKSQSRTDWARRPLSEKQLSYAIDDVRYLYQAYSVILGKLKELGRLSWLDSEFERLMSEETYQPKPEAMWKKVKGHQNLRARQLAILRELAAWRENAAIQKDLPRRWLASDDLLIDLARQQPRNAEAAAQLRNVNAGNPYIKTWLKCIRRVDDMPKEHWPRLPVYRKPTEQQSLLVDLLMLAVRYKASRYNITAGMIASRKKIEQMVMAHEKTLSNDWRGGLVNKLFTQILDGKVCIHVTGGDLVEVTTSE